MTRDNARLYFFLLQQNRWLAIGIFFAAFLLYLRTLAPDVVDADGGEFQFAAWNFSLVHPTGYPLYLILGGIFQHLLPLGNPAYRLNLFTAMTAALAVAAVYLAASEITHHRSAALIATLSFAVTRTFWYDASAAETYDLNAFFIALLTYIAVRWQSEPTTNKFATFCFAYGLALTHHRTIVLWLPAFLVFFALAAWRSRLILRLRSGQANHASSFDSAREKLITVYVLLFAAALTLLLHSPSRSRITIRYALSRVRT